MASTRRQFLQASAVALAGSLLGPLGAGCSGGVNPLSPAAGNPSGPGRRPNLLLVLVDQMRLPPVGYAPDEGEAPGIREILGFEPTLSPDNPFARFFPGLLRLRQHAVVCRRHYIASAACAPSRTTFLTGQYPSLHGVDQVDGIFKDATEVTFLDPEGVPTVGDWFRAGGYETYYFGKWHVSHVEEPYSLEPWGFCCYETSGPEPHGAAIQNLGVYRDPGFRDIVKGFLDQQGATPSEKPWFAVASLVNPHDIAAYPTPFYLQGGQGVTAPDGVLLNPQPIPPQGRLSNPDPDGGATVPLNPDGFPQACFNLPRTAFEDLSTKPECQEDAAWKVQVGLTSMYPQFFQRVLPYPLQDKAAPLSEAWSLSYGQFYLYLQYLVDLELRRILEALDANGLAENTIVVFTSDHGEYAMAHGQMLQKWHSGYEEGVRVPFVVSSPLVNAQRDVMRDFDQTTSHVDLAPTLLGLAGFTGPDLVHLRNRIEGHRQVRDLVGADLTPFLLGQSREPVRNGDGSVRPGVLFTTDDRITELPAGVANPSKQAQFDSFTQSVADLIAAGAPLAPGPVRQPNSVHMFCDGDWKLNRYLDPAGANPDQWELYHLPSDPREATNLLDFRTGGLRAGVAVPGFTTEQLELQVASLHAALRDQEARLLLVPA